MFLAQTGFCSVQSTFTDTQTQSVSHITRCPKKVVHQTHSDNFVSSYQIFKILSLVEKDLNFQQSHIILPTIHSVCCHTNLWKLKVQILGNLTLYDFHQICGHRTVLTSTMLTTRYRASSSSKSISHGCTTLMNWSSVCCMFGMTLTRSSLTMQLMSDVGIFGHVCGQKMDTSSNYCDNIQPYGNRRFSFCQMWHDF